MNATMIDGAAVAAATTTDVVSLVHTLSADPTVDGILVQHPGRSAILGLPAGMLLLRANATVSYAHSRTRDLADLVADADIVVAAVGRPALVHGEWIKPGAVVIDAGYHPGPVGDVDHDDAAARAGLITPVPGGVGPTTIAVLLEQTVDAARAAL